MSSDFYKTSILPHSAIIIKICRAYSNSQEDYEDYYQEVCLQIWKSKDNFKNKLRILTCTSASNDDTASSQSSRSGSNKSALAIATR